MSLTSSLAKLASPIVVCSLLSGCAADNSDGAVETQEPAEVETSSSALNGTVSFTGCSTARKTIIQNAINYLYNRVFDGAVELGECMNEAYFWQNKGKDGRSIAAMLQLNVVTSVTCQDMDPGVNASAPVGISGEKLTIDYQFTDTKTVPYIAAVIAHEIMHNRGFSHEDAGDYYSNSVPEQMEACVRNWAPFAAVDTGYALYWDGAMVGHEASWTLTQGKDNCQWNKDTYPNKKVECYYNGLRIGYELYWDGKRAGFEPKWTATSAQNNCQWNKDTYPGKKVECVFNGKPLGYELYWDGKRAGFEPKWTSSSAKSNCQWNKDTYPGKKVECYLNGEHVGYQLLWNGKRAGFEPNWTLEQATANCDWNETQYPTKVVECLFEGSRI